MPIEPMITDPAIIASLITIVVAFALMYFFTLLDKRDIVKELDDLKSRLDELEEKYFDSVAASNLQTKAIMEKSDQIKTLYSVIENIHIELNSIQGRITSLKNDKTI